MASFRDYEAVQTATVPLFHGESLQVRPVSSPEFLIAAMPFHREKVAKGELTAEEETRYNIALTFSLVDSWTFDDDLTLENFTEMLQSPARASIAGQICKKIDAAASDIDSIVKKKSPGLSSGSGETGSLTEQLTEAKHAAKRSKRSTSKQDANQKA